MVGEQLPEPAAGAPGAGGLGGSGRAAELETTPGWDCCASLGGRRVPGLLGCRPQVPWVLRLSQQVPRGGQGRGLWVPWAREPASGPFADAWLQPPSCSRKRVPPRVQMRGPATAEASQHGPWAGETLVRPGQRSPSHPQVWQTQLRGSMAEQEPTAEQLAQIAADNEEDEHSVGYRPPAQKSIQEIQELDKDDESLRKYKEALLGRVAVAAGEWVARSDTCSPSGSCCWHRLWA